MTSELHASLDRLSAALQVLPMRLPPVQPTEVLLKKLGAEAALRRAPPAPVLEEVRQRLRAALEAGGPNAALDPRDIKRAPWLLWQRDPPAVQFPGLLERVLTDAYARPRVLYYLIEAWLGDFAADGPGIDRAGLAIQSMLHIRDDLRLAVWRRAHSEFAMFQRRRGPSAFARIILTSAQPVGAVLAASGFAEPSRAVSNYMRAVQAELLAAAKELMLRGGAIGQFDRLLEFLTREGALRFPDAKVAIASALCRAWLPPCEREPDTAFRDRTKDFLIRWLGNPQIRSWGSADEEAKLVRRWLASASLKVFFQLISDHALDRQWKYREAFWSACLAKGLISDAWLVLGPRVHADAQAHPSLGSAFGSLESGASVEKSVLLLRIDRLVFAEWSHNGSMRAWRDDMAPKLGKPSYSASELRRPCLSFPADPMRPGTSETGTGGLRHMGSESGVWQRRAAALLTKHVNFRLSTADWQVR